MANQQRSPRLAGLGRSLSRGLLLASLVGLSGGLVGCPLVAIAQSSAQSLSTGEAAILTAYQARRSDVWVEAAGQVVRVLADDVEGSRHQRFILRLSSGHTVLVSHNIDIAPRLPLVNPGGMVRFRGEYEWNAQGGVIHWTHHDPQGRQAGGWLDFQGQRYQ